MFEIRPLRPDDNRQLLFSGDAKPDAITFYKKYGCETFEMISGELGDRPSPLPMILPLGSIPCE